MAADTKTSKTIKINFFSRMADLVYLAEILYVLLVGRESVAQWYQNEKNL